MKIYMVEWDLYDEVEWNDAINDYEFGGNFYIEKQEFYTSKEVALERSARLTWDYSHEWSDDEQKVVELDLYDRYQMEMSYDFPVREFELQDITIDDLPPKEEM